MNVFINFPYSTFFEFLLFKLRKLFKSLQQPWNKLSSIFFRQSEYCIWYFAFKFHIYCMSMPHRHFNFKISLQEKLNWMRRNISKMIRDLQTKLIKGILILWLFTVKKINLRKWYLSSNIWGNKNRATEILIRNGTIFRLQQFLGKKFFFMKLMPF